jgi:hypothetical protein
MIVLATTTMMDHGGVGPFHHGGRGHDRAPASFGEAFPNSLNTARVVAEGGCGNSTGHVQETSGRVGESRRIAIGWRWRPSGLWFPGDILFWRLMAPKNLFAVVHGANALTLVDFAHICVVP